MSAKVIIMRGPSGSGKSTLAQKYLDDFSGLNKIIVSADNFMMVDGVYAFHPSKLSSCHQKCFHAFVDACSKAFTLGEPSLIIVDNTNIKHWEFAPYETVAKKLGFEVEFAQPDGPWDAKLFAERNKHGVPEEVIQSMIDRFEARP